MKLLTVVGVLASFASAVATNVLSNTYLRIGDGTEDSFKAGTAPSTAPVIQQVRRVERLG